MWPFHTLNGIHSFNRITTTAENTGVCMSPAVTSTWSVLPYFLQPFTQAMQFLWKTYAHLFDDFFWLDFYPNITICWDNSRSWFFTQCCAICEWKYLVYPHPVMCKTPSRAEQHPLKMPLLSTLLVNSYKYFQIVFNPNTFIDLQFLFISQRIF